MNATGYTRNRWWLLALIFTVVALGLASRKYPGMFPASLGNYPGDTLWALTAYLVIALVVPSAPVWKLATIALTASYFVEFSQLLQIAWLNTLRSTRVGHLLLGQGFDRFDLVALTVGIGLAAIVDTIFFLERQAT
jgi:uncharacterized paraquat-inducible protein A